MGSMHIHSIITNNHERMKLLVLLLSSLFAPLCISGTEVPLTEYVNERGTMRIFLSSEKFYMIIKQPHMPLYFTDTLAICDVTQINDEFYMISSEQPESLLQRYLEVTQSNDKGVSDEINVTFDFPECVPMKILMLLDHEWSDLNEYQYKKGPVSITVPNTTKKIFLGFSPDFSVVVHEHPHRYTFQGILTTDTTISFSVNPGVNQITIRNPILNASFFERYYVQDEFIRVVNGQLYWRGITFYERQ